VFALEKVAERKISREKLAMKNGKDVSSCPALIMHSFSCH